VPPASDRPERWTLSRAGIINVYQYGDETLEFGGGRLLLRGVNGSGKSTAMNMLLPFLLDADTRRIDAAGEQSGVLRAWMLSGRDEPQPQGYLWLEVAKGDSYLNFGCGIRANRATDQVTTWWFITSRRIGLDLHLVEGRVPVSRDALRVLLEPDPLFGQDQRADYRAELRRRIFGGADIEQHLHLLRTVRSPRVGDRLDAELPQYLMDALPQLSDSALDDAAQPLEDLEEHRRNVAELARTAEALDAVYAMYQNYARAELHNLADRTLEAARMCRELRRSEDKARTNYEEALGRCAARPRSLVGVARAVFPRKRRSLRPMMAGPCWATRQLSQVRAGAWGLYSSLGRKPRSCSGTPVSSSVGRWIYRRSGCCAGS
jgi:hypothetical protein